jgi:hypothetical protein
MWDSNYGQSKRYAADLVAKVYLTKAESSLLTQARTGHIGLKDYLKKTAAVESSECVCGDPRETFEHLIHCSKMPQDTRPKDITNVWNDLQERTPLRRSILRWVVTSGRIHQYRLAAQLDPPDPMIGSSLETLTLSLSQP